MPDETPDIPELPAPLARTLRAAQAGQPVKPAAAAPAAPAAPVTPAAPARAKRDLGGLGQLSTAERAQRQQIDGLRTQISQTVISGDSLATAGLKTITTLRASETGSASAATHGLDLDKAEAFLTDLGALLDKHFPAH